MIFLNLLLDLADICGYFHGFYIGVHRAFIYLIKYEQNWRIKIPYLGIYGQKMSKMLILPPSPIHPVGFPLITQKQ